MMHISPFALGATLYMPIIRPDIIEVAMGRKLRGVKSVVLCLEDALASSDVEHGLRNLRALLDQFQSVGRDGGDVPLLFIRPRNVEMAFEIASMAGIQNVDGFVAPKCRPGHMLDWYNAVQGTGLVLMPTLETHEFFDPFAVRDFKDELTSLGRDQILALRVGGNDLMSCLGIRRIRGMSLYDGPLNGLLSSLVGQLGSAGYALTAPVYEILDDPVTLHDELLRDVAHGFVGKTAIHPCQVAIIQKAFEVTPAEVAVAKEILADDAPAVFRSNGAMCEPSTHRRWAANILERAKFIGIAGEWAASNIRQTIRAGAEWH